LIYTVFEEIFQFNPTQLFAQVGGDIGLYTGFSVLAIWHFLVSLCGFLKNRKTKIGQQKPDASVEIGAPRSELSENRWPEASDIGRCVQLLVEDFASIDELGNTIQEMNEKLNEISRRLDLEY
jgi:hypothetical protein